MQAQQTALWNLSADIGTPPHKGFATRAAVRFVEPIHSWMDETPLITKKVLIVYLRTWRSSEGVGNKENCDAWSPVCCSLFDALPITYPNKNIRTQPNLRIDWPSENSDTSAMTPIRTCSNSPQRPERPPSGKTIFSYSSCNIKITVTSA